MLRKSHIICLFLLMPAFGYAQFDHISGVWGTHLEKADQLFEAKFYEEAIVFYEKELDRFDFHEEALTKIAECYRKLGKYDRMHGYYTIIANTREFEDKKNELRYAESLLSLGHYEAAVTWYEKYLESHPDQRVAKNRLAGIANIARFFKDSMSYEIGTLPINSHQSEFGALVHGNSFYFTSAREKDLIIRHDNMREVESLLDVYRMDPNLLDLDSISEPPVRLRLKNHFKSNDGPAAFSENRMAISRNMGSKKSEGINSLGIFFYSVTDFTALEEFPFNSKEYSITHPALHGNTLFFASDMPGGFGGFDLFRSTFNGSMWSEPENLGQKINTPADEVFPFYNAGVLFFSSKGHPGLGGFDIYKAKINDPDYIIINMGYPLNSGWDDLSISLDNQLKKGYFSSNRPGGLGHDDIYKVIVHNEVTAEPGMITLSLQVSDFINFEGVPEATVHIVPFVDQVVSPEERIVTKTGDDGYFMTKLDPMHFQVYVMKNGYEASQFEIDGRTSSVFAEEVFLQPSFYLENISLDSILFQFDEAILTASAEKELEAIVSIMEKYPELKLEIVAHTDSRGESDYNLWLSEMRAVTTTNFLMDMGVDLGRVEFRGMGESTLLNHCKDGVECSDEEHSVNRRIEFQFILPDN